MISASESWNSPKVGVRDLMWGSLALEEPAGVESMEHFEQLKIRVELKYCERCGGLWLRHAMSGSTFCDPCEQAETLMPMKQARAMRNGVGSDSVPGAVLAFGSAVGVNGAAVPAADGRRA